MRKQQQCFTPVLLYGGMDMYTYLGVLTINMGLVKGRAKQALCQWISGCWGPPNLSDVVYLA